MYQNLKYCCIISFCFFYILKTESIAKNDWDMISLWKTSTDSKSYIKIRSDKCKYDNGIKIEYKLKNGGWVQMRKIYTDEWKDNIPIVFLLKSSGTVSSSFLEIKFVDSDGSNFIKKTPLKKYKDWTQIVVYKDNLEYGWGGDNKFDGLKEFYFAISGSGNGTVWFDEIRPGKPGLKPSFPPAGPILDPDREKKGFGFKQRRDKKLIPEEPLVLEYLKLIQDISSPEKNLLPSMEDNYAHTFNNALVAMVFILRNEKERAERILNFYSDATEVDNPDITKQNFFYKGEPRGFYQQVMLNKCEVPAYHRIKGTYGGDRWIGDMAWLLIAYKYYEKKYNSNKYEKIVNLIKNLLISFYKDTKVGGYIQHGWRNDDAKLHEDHGHHEGNIGCYAALKLCGENEYAENIKKWLEYELKDKQNLPLDLYTWRMCAFGKDYAYLLDIPEHDFRYRKTINVNNKKVVGLFHGPEPEIDNIWLDGVGHIACAYYFAGNDPRGNFYANQMDAFLIDRVINDRKVKVLPYTANQDGGYGWVDTNKGFVSTVCWYIFAKNKFNPLTLTQKIE